MKEKIFEALKQKYSPLGLGSDILSAHAEALAALGFVTEDNLQSVVDAQSTYLSRLQQLNDKRVNDASKSIEERLKREQAEAEAKKAEAAAQEKARLEAEAEAKKQAEAAAKAAAEKAKKETEEKKAKEDEERKRLEALKKDNEIPEYFKKAQEEALARAKEERKQAEAERKELMDLVKSMKESFDAKSSEFDAEVAKLNKDKEEQGKVIQQMKAEAEAKAVEEAKRIRHEKIVSKAKELGIPQFRIDEGINIPDEADDDAITNTLSKMASNYKAMEQRASGGFGLHTGNHTVSKEEADSVAKLLCN